MLLLIWWSNNGQEPPDDYDRSFLSDRPKCKDCTHYRYGSLDSNYGICQKAEQAVSADYYCPLHEVDEF